MNEIFLNGWKCVLPGSEKLQEMQPCAAVTSVQTAFQRWVNKEINLFNFSCIFIPQNFILYWLYILRTLNHHHHCNVRVSALALVGGFPKMPLLHTSRSCASSLLNFIFIKSSIMHSLKFFYLTLYLHPPQLSYLYMQTPSRPNLSAPNVRTTLIFPHAPYHTHFLYLTFA